MLRMFFSDVIQVEFIAHLVSKYMDILQKKHQYLQMVQQTLKNAEKKTE